MWFSDDVMKYPYDPARAKQLFAEIGLRDSNGDGFLEDSEGHTAEINLVTNASNNQRVETASFVARNLQEVGIKANAVPIAFGALVDKMQTTFDFDALVLGWQPNPPPGPSGNKNIILSSGLQHACFASQQQPYREMGSASRNMQQAETALDRAERYRLLAIQRIWSIYLNKPCTNRSDRLQTKFETFTHRCLPRNLELKEIYVSSRTRSRRQRSRRQEVRCQRSEVSLLAADFDL
jgi:ABC-type oligopeptide transport system substrate-binding subunit